MKFFDNISIKRKQVLIILLTSAVTLLLACSSFVFFDVTTFRRELVAQAESLAEVVGNNCTAAVDFNDASSATEALAALRGEQNIQAAFVFRKDGGLFASYQRNAQSPFQPDTAVRSGDGHKFTPDRLILSRSIAQSNERIGTIVLVYDLTELSKRLAHYTIIGGLVFLISLSVAFVLSSRLQRVISEPIQSLARAARKIAIEKDYSIRVAKGRTDEMGQLIEGFNEMLSQIQERDGALQLARENLELRVANRTEELAGSLSLLNATLESTADGILVVNQRGRVTHCNTKFLEMWGLPAETHLSGRQDPVFRLAEELVKDGKTFVAKLRELEADAEREGYELFELKDGRVFERFSQPQRLDGKCVGRVSCFRDITERRRAEEALRERLALQERLAKIAATVPGVIHTFQQRADGSCCMPYASPRVEEIYGMRPEELAVDASRIFEVIAPEDVEGLRKAIAESARTRMPWRAEFRVRHPVHGQIWVEGHSVPEPDVDGGMMWHGFLSNITERKQIEEKMAELNKELIATSRQAGMAEVATGVLHNVGNVLNSVNISATLVSDGIRKSKASNLGRVVALLEEQGDGIAKFFAEDARAKQLPNYLRQLSDQLAKEQEKATAELDLLRKNLEHIKDIVAMQQSYAKVSGVTETLHITELVEDALRINSSALNRHEIEVVRDYAEVPPVTLEKHKVLQVLVNLIRNAKYACDDSGKNDKKLTVRVGHGQCGVQIAVIDNGIGIPPENLTRIFNHGFTTRKQGHGFGLHSGALVVKEMGGALTVKSEGTGKGATFLLDIPMQPPKGRNE